jgi:opacity protein-like surface antigen
MIRVGGAALSTLLLVSGVAGAAAPEEGWFVGASYGLTEIDDKAFRSATDVVSTDDKDSSVQLWGGYRLANWVSMEGRYSTLGEYVANEDDGTPQGAQSKSEAEALTVNMKLILPFGSSGFDVYGQLGIGAAKWKSDLVLTEFVSEPPNNGQTNFRASGNEPVVSYGVGVRWTVIPRLTLQLAVDAYQFKGASSITYSADVPVVDPITGLPTFVERTLIQKITFDADLLTTSLGLQYNF